MSLHEIIGEFGLVSKIDVADIDASLRWYEEKLRLRHDPRFDVPGWWAQLNVPGLRRVAIGLNKDAGGTEGRGQVTTFVVPDIETAREGLIARGVEVGPITDVPHGVRLAFFKDLDGNDYGLRQNAENHPAATEIGAE
jgi:predicted enzyme related to lactoylglutathione lyase